MKAIETRYKGYRFRSRLEARWAVFFDALGVDWRYEPEGYALKIPYSRFGLPSEVAYLPDFYLPGLSLWVEVKGECVSWPNAALEKAEALRDYANEGVIVVGPDPTAFYPWIGFDVGDSSAGSSCWYEACFGMDGSTPVLVDSGIAGRIFYNNGDFEYPLSGYSEKLFSNSQFLRCVSAFRSARFEHGECGAPA